MPTVTVVVNLKTFMIEHLSSLIGKKGKYINRFDNASERTFATQLAMFVYSIVFAPTLTKRVIENNVANTAITYHVQE